MSVLKKRPFPKRSAFICDRGSAPRENVVPKAGLNEIHKNKHLSLYSRRESTNTTEDTSSVVFLLVIAYEKYKDISKNNIIF